MNKIEDLSRAQLLNILNEIESAYPVYQWKINDVYVWPFLKVHIGFFYYIKKYSLSDEATSLRKTTLSVRVINWVKGLKNLARFAYKALGKTDIVFSTYSNYRSNIGPLSYNKFTDPLMDLLRVKGRRAVVLENTRLDFKKKKYSSHRIIETASLLPYFSIFNKIFGGRNTGAVQMERYGDFLDELGRHDPSIRNELAIEKLKAKVSTIDYYSTFYKYIFRILKPKLVFCVCYYSIEHFGLCKAARELGVASVDIQHGPAGDGHTAYSQWNNIPESGLQLLPQYFWKWGQTSAVASEKWIRKQDYHINIVGGNPWTGYSKLRENVAPPAGIGRGSLVVLYSLQPNLSTSEAFPEPLVDAIKNSPENWKWWIRWHPRQSETEKETLEKFLTARDIFQRIEVGWPSTQPLPLVLTYTGIHITNWSGCAIEASNEEIFTIFIHEDGAVITNEMNRGSYEVMPNYTSTSLTSSIEKHTAKASSQVKGTHTTELTEAAMDLLLSRPKG